ncbi:double-strand break repair helicase AddA [Sphingomonas lutea]|uniref:DNA 3'-5' helicase n=1 Tax=Sphingomonas lutea TaxID=1045317 RepID=A0A7G9SFB6_9SPHN|nr:double-strand break repair helicase AddA [Sphingomonas lutea]QNN66541.1 double-strand break repair helicase AddA [Sphingomonas lutea]
MSARFKPFPPLNGAQARAADPMVHAALSASAGSGKTQVLTARVLRLLLKGARPESILCLTFTKAAAAEMANRVGARLAQWVRLKDSDLAIELDRLGERNDPPTRERARKLFARVLDCPGGLRIQTIHSFAQSLLAAFPAEAGITPGFQPIEGRAEQELVRRTLADLLSIAEAREDVRLIDDVKVLSRRLGEARAVEYLQACARSAEAFAGFASPDLIEPAMRRTIGVPEGSTEDYIAEQCGDSGFDCDLLRAVADANRRWGAQTGLQNARAIEDWLALTPIERAAQLGELRKVVLTEKGTAKVTAGQTRAEPHYETHAGRLANLIGNLLDQQDGARLAAEMSAGLRAGFAFAEAYTRAKRAAGVADFDDLIQWTRKLLTTPGMGDWVRFKLDRQVDHVLIDEAQDTNAPQWEIIHRIVEEFFTGSSETERRWRTLFMVGDFKQAIYGFQGTDPHAFEAARQDFRVKAESLSFRDDLFSSTGDAAREFRDLSIAASFRSAQPVLDVVDAVIGHLGHGALALPEPPPPHRAHHATRAGLVELWEPFAVTEDDEDETGEERWVDLRDRLYAEALATRIRALVDEAPMLESTGNRLTPGDILVLVRSRGELASLLVARLLARRIPVAGVDRLHLQEPLAVQDLLAAVRFAVQPDDDLSLAELLVSPLIGWDQEQLRELAFGRNRSLWAELRHRSDEMALLRTARDTLAELLRIADFVTPSRFLETILSGPMQGRRKLYARLGLASRDPIDELMTSALDFERNETPSLDRFLSWFDRGDVDVQRDPGQPSNEVRVMTVHGAKGLEAPVVILADATADPGKLGRIPLTLDFPLDDHGKLPLLRPKKAERRAPFDALIDRQDERDLQEHWRLLYVALTRAADRLIVAGVAPRRDRPANCWHLAVERALDSLGAEAVADGEERTRRVYGSASGLRAPAARQVQPPPVALPGWVHTPAPVEERPPRPLAPSAIGTNDEAAPAPTAAMRAAAQRGTIIHLLLERLVAVPPDTRKVTAEAWLERSAGVDDATARHEIAEQVCDILADPRFAPLFGPSSLGEAPIAATLPDGRVIAGTIDRLLIEETEVSVIDFKTGRVPDSAADVPPSHRAQMSAYEEALRVIFPGRRIRASLLYTAAPRLFELSA